MVFPHEWDNLCESLSGETGKGGREPEELSQGQGQVTTPTGAMHSQPLALSEVSGASQPWGLAQPDGSGLF